MKHNFLIIAFAFSVFFIQKDSLAQSATVKGVVYTFDSIPVISANIEVKSSKLEIMTDSSGHFSIECAMNDVLKITAQGFYTQKVKIKDKTGNVNVNLKLKSGIKNVDAAIENGNISNEKSFRELAIVDSKAKDFSKYLNIYEIIEAKFPSVQISQGYLIIRGANRLMVSPSANAALIVVDGTINDNSILATLPTSFVKSIKIMKEGSYAKYGARGTNGVVLIETNR